MVRSAVMICSVEVSRILDSENDNKNQTTKQQEMATAFFFSGR